MNPISFLRRVRLAFVLLGILPCGFGLAQERSGEPAPAILSDPQAITINFPGGPLSKLMAGLTTHKNAQLSIIQSAGLDPILPAFSVRDVRVEAVIAALGRLLEPQGFGLAPVGPNLAVLTQFEHIRAPAFASLRIGPKLGDQSVEEFIAAIQAACAFAHPEQKASTLRFKYHPGTKLLFVAGTRQEVEIAHQVFGSLPDTPATTPPSSAGIK